MNKLIWAEGIAIGNCGIKYEVYRFKDWSAIIHFGNDTIRHHGFSQLHLAMAKCQHFHDHLTKEMSTTLQYGLWEGEARLPT